MKIALAFVAGAVVGVVATSGVGLWLFGDLLGPLEHVARIKDGLDVENT